jgi:hypothetical protein
MNATQKHESHIKKIRNSTFLTYMDQTTTGASPVCIQAQKNMVFASPRHLPQSSTTFHKAKGSRYEHRTQSVLPDFGANKKLRIMKSHRQRISKQGSIGTLLYSKE